jgi:hypothetical protein
MCQYILEEEKKIPMKEFNLSSTGSYKMINIKKKDLNVHRSLSSLKVLHHIMCQYKNIEILS